MHRLRPVRQWTILVALIALLGLGLAATAGRNANPASAAPNAQTSQLQTTSSLNLRSGPGTSYSVLAVMPANAWVTSTGESSGDWLEVIYKGTTGWANAFYLGGDSGPTTGNATVTSSLNLRSGPGANFAVLTVMPAGSAVTITELSSNGYRNLWYQGQAGWASEAYLDFDGGYSEPVWGVGHTTSNLNLRSQPNTSSQILLVIPAGVTVDVGNQRTNGYVWASYNGTSGWAYEAYLEAGTGSGGGQSSGSLTVTSNLNLRAEPSTSGKIILVMKSGASVEPTGLSQNGFLQVTYQGSTGWAYADYLA
jgi:uncharacterized protein YraI